MHLYCKVTNYLKIYLLAIHVFEDLHLLFHRLNPISGSVGRACVLVKLQNLYRDYIEVDISQWSVLNNSAHIYEWVSH